MTTRTFTRDQLDAIGVPFECASPTDPEPNGAAVELHCEQVDTRRWVSVHQLVFRAPDDGKAWAVTYERGLTESQDGHDYWGYASEVTATEMEQRSVTVQQWLPVGDATSNDTTTAPVTITPDTARHVLFHYGADGGFRPGNFTQVLMTAFDTADQHNEHILTAAYPELGAAFRLAKYEETGTAQLRAIAGVTPS